MWQLYAELLDTPWHSTSIFCAISLHNATVVPMKQQTDHSRIGQNPAECLGIHSFRHKWPGTWTGTPFKRFLHVSTSWELTWSDFGPSLLFFSRSFLIQCRCELCQTTYPKKKWCNILAMLLHGMVTLLAFLLPHRETAKTKALDSS